MRQGGERLERAGEPVRGGLGAEPDGQRVRRVRIGRIHATAGEHVDIGGKGHGRGSPGQQDLRSVGTGPDEDDGRGGHRDGTCLSGRGTRGAHRRDRTVSRLGHTAARVSRSWSASASGSVTGRRQAKPRQT